MKKESPPEQPDITPFIAQTMQTPKLACEPDIFHALSATLEDLGVVGESANCLLLFLVLCSRVLPRPLCMVLRGPSGGGKSYLVETVTRTFPDLAYFAVTAMSPKFLTRPPVPMVHKILILEEAAGLGGRKAIYFLRSLITKGEIRYGTLVPQKSGDYIGKVLWVPGPTGLVVTTTGLDIDEELENRMVSAHIIDTAAQTRLVSKAIGVKYGREQRPPNLDRWIEFQVWFQQQANTFWIPFGEVLSSEIQTPAVRQRRDTETVMKFVGLSSLIHQASRRRSSRGRVVAQEADYANVYPLISPLIANDVGSAIPTEMRMLVHAVKDLTDELDLRLDGVNVAQLARRLGWGHNTTWRWTKKAVRDGWLHDDQERPSAPNRLSPGQDLPEDVELLPTPAHLHISIETAKQKRDVRDG